MLELIAAAILQFAVLSATPSNEADTAPNLSSPTSTTTASVDHGMGGWGDDH